MICHTCDNAPATHNHPFAYGVYINVANLCCSCFGCPGGCDALDECRECGTTLRVERGWCARCYVANKT